MAKENQHFQILMQQALAGNSRAYEVLLRESARRLRPWLARYLKGNAEADDVLQEILLSIHKARHTYDATRPFEPWLFAIAKFRLQDYLRKLYGNKLRYAVDLDDIAENFAAPVTESGGMAELLRESLRQLPERQAAIIELMHVQGFTAKEAGARLGMKESAVKVAAHRAYKLLRKKLGES